MTAAGGLLLVALTATACTADPEADATATSAATVPTIAAEVTPTEAVHEAAAPDTGDMLAALLLIDSAGFHSMDEALNGGAPAVDAAWLGRAQQARIAAQAVVWAPGAAEAAHAFIEATTALEAALEADDAAGAAPLAVAAHETQHELSHEAYHLIADAPGSTSGGGATLAALALIGRAGFPAMEAALTGTAPEVNVGWVGATANARVAAQAVVWPGESQAAANAFVTAATALEAALEADDATAAAEAAVAANKAQATLATRGFGALSGMRGSAHSNGSVLAAIAIIDAVGFHGIDDALNGADPAIDKAWAAKVTQAKRAAQTIGWPEGAQAAAEAFAKAAAALEPALAADDVEAAAKAAGDAHGTQHALSHNVWAALGGGTSGH
ncbi:MAG: hypothetical protein CVU47_00835 [Chloroflexi bacterium HGW-Chloroflexi-9]|nr:MAG: hypothetical protein CVU47_00835 [Chloroflexi bacterium HGW-Chloroflexi-9]